MANTPVNTQREERHLMRMRGAGPKTVAAGFDFAFTATTSDHDEARPLKRARSAQCVSTSTAPQSAKTATLRVDQDTKARNDRALIESHGPIEPAPAATKLKTASRCIESGRSNTTTLSVAADGDLFVQAMVERSTLISRSRSTNTEQRRSDEDIERSRPKPDIKQSIESKPPDKSVVAPLSTTEPQTGSIRAHHAPVIKPANVFRSRAALKTVDANRLIPISSGQKEPKTKPQPRNARTSRTMTTARLNAVNDDSDDDPLSRQISSSTAIPKTVKDSEPEVCLTMPLMAHSLVKTHQDTSSTQKRQGEASKSVARKESASSAVLPSRRDRRAHQSRVLPADDDSMDLDDLIMNIASLTKT